jgi:fumarylacetoacetate (FAA) hydrolase
VKLVTYDTGDGPRAGVVVDGQVLDVASLLGEQGGLRDVRALLELPGDPLARLKSALRSARAAQGMPLDSVRRRAPILQPPTVRDFMAYEGHASAGGARRLAEAWYPLLGFYFSSPLCIFGPEDAVPYSSASDQLDYELELAAVMTDMLSAPDPSPSSDLQDTAGAAELAKFFRKAARVLQNSKG